MTVQGDKRIQERVIVSVWHDLDRLISKLNENCFAHGFAIGAVWAAAFWTLYLW